MAKPLMYFTINLLPIQADFMDFSLYFTSLLPFSFTTRSIRLMDDIR